MALLKSLQKKKGLRRYIGPKRLVLLLLLVLFVLWAWDYYKSGALSPVLIEQYLHAYPVGSVLLFIAIYAISVVAALPSLPLNLAAGFFWGGLLGGVYTVIGVTLGSWLSFVAVRWFAGQPLANAFDNRWASRVQEEFARNGWKFVAFARLNPIIPTGPLNYLLGLTSLSHRGFIWTTLICLLLPSVAVAYIGDTLQTFATQESGANEIIRGMLMVSAAVTCLGLIKFASMIYKKRLERE